MFIESRKRNLRRKILSGFINAIRFIYLPFSFFALDILLRLVFYKNVDFEEYAFVPYLFTICWTFIFTTIFTAFPKKAGRIAYGIFYYIWATYIIVQLGYFAIFDKFLFLKDFMYSSEGLQYAGFVKEILDIKFIIYIVAIILIGAIGIIIFPNVPKKKFYKIFKFVPAVVGICGLCVIPKVCYGQAVDKTSWNAWQSPAYEYMNFSYSVWDLQLAGLYQYVARDFKLNVSSKVSKNSSERTKEIDEFFAERPEHQDNAMTGIFEGKNLIVVMMESLDDWVINQENTPTIQKMMDEGINFTNMYTPLYTTGCTFNTEFSFNVGNFPFSNGNTVYSLSENEFNESVANLFNNKGYTVNSFHKGTPEFYKRGIMHKAFGYNKYNSYLEYTDNEKDAEIDTFLTETDDLYKKLVNNDENPFMSFVVTYSGHLPYNDSNHLSVYAAEKYPELIKEGRNSEVNYLSAQARITDDMFKELLNRLEEDGILDDTVIIGYADHVSYGITDSELLKQLSIEAGSEITYKTPAFIYCKGYDHIESNKIMQTVDLLPTIGNLFNLDVPDVMGQDVFDDNYKGYVVFPNNSWLTDEAFVLKGNLVWNNGFTDEQVEDMNNFVQRFYSINDAIIDTDYYRTYAKRKAESSTEVNSEMTTETVTE